MLTLEWIGKDKVINHHLQVPYRVLEHQYYLSGRPKRCGNCEREQNLSETTTWKR